MNLDLVKMKTMYTFGRFKDRVAVITASTHGIGYAMADRLASEGASVVISSRNEDNVIKAVESLRKRNYNVEGVVCHVSDRDQRKLLFDTAAKKFGGMDILISNAGVNPAFGPITTTKTDEQMWDKIFDVNLKASWLLAKEGIPLLLKNRTDPNILFLSSAAAFHVFPKGLLGAYSISKTAVLGLTKSVALEQAPHIRVNSLCPGYIDTPFANTFSAKEDSHKDVVKGIAMNRPGRPEEVASVAAFLCSEDASFITGENIAITGGAVTRI